MIVIHAAIDHHHLMLWAENTTAQSFACSAQELNEILSHYLAPGDRSSGCSYAESSAEILLPVASGKPMLSSQSSDTPITAMAKFTVSVVRLNPAQALETLTSINTTKNNRTTVPRGVLSSEIYSLIDLLYLAATITVSQQFLPSIRKETGREYDGKTAEYIAEWQPLYNASQLSHINTIVKHLPTVLLTMAPSAGVEEAKYAFSRENKITLVKLYLQGLVDCIVRASCDPNHLPHTTSASNHDAWLTALLSQHSNVIDYDLVECEQLCRQVDAWQKPITSLKTAPFRLCFRLDEPEPPETDGDIPIVSRQQLESGFNGGVFLTPPSLSAQHSQNENWKISFHLQSQSDPSLIVPAEKIWHDTRTKVFFNSSDFNAKEYLLLALGQASKLYPGLEDSLRTDSPASHSVDNETAFEFLNEKALLLEEAGFGIIMPSWWTSSKKKVKLLAELEEPIVVGMFNPSTVAEFHYRVALGDKSLSFEELSELAQHKLPLVQLRGEWLHIDHDHLARVLQHWKKKSNITTLKDILGLAVGAKEELCDIAIDGIVSDGWIKDLLKQLKEPSVIENLEPPTGLRAELRPYQLRGYSWLTFLKNWGIGACLADDMGLGKTIQTLALIQKIYNDKELYKPTLIICPTSVMNNWHKEAQRFTPDLKLMIHHGGDRMKGDQLAKKVKKSHIVISSYALLFRDEEHLKNIEWDGVILDEAQNIKNATTKQATVARALSANYRIALTGTPVENNLRELWSLMHFLNPGLLGSMKSFDAKFYIPIQKYNDTSARLKLKQITKPFILRRMKTDKTIIEDLPDKQESKVYCQLTEEQVSLYEAVLEEFEERIADAFGVSRAILIASTLTRLKQVCNHPAQFLHDNSPILERSGKMIRLGEIVQKILSSRGKVLIFTQFTGMADLLKPYLESQFGFRVLYLHGGVPRNMRDKIIERFRNDASSPIFILSIKAGGTGLNLTAANHVIHFDRWWNPAVENQATDRAFRIGQTKNVQVYKFVCVGTVEERIDEMIQKKQELADSVIGTGESWLTHLFNNDLRKAFAISRKALKDDTAP